MKRKKRNPSSTVEEMDVELSNEEIANLQDEEPIAEGRIVRRLRRRQPVVEAGEEFKASSALTGLAEEIGSRRVKAPQPQSLTEIGEQQTVAAERLAEAEVGAPREEPLPLADIPLEDINLSEETKRKKKKRKVRRRRR